MDGCIYRTKDGECDLYAEGGKFTAFCDMEHCDNIAPTNADRIRAMTDEELGLLIAWNSYETPPWCREHDECPFIGLDHVPCEKCALDWLKQEAAE